MDALPHCIWELVHDFGGVHVTNLSRLSVAQISFILVAGNIADTWLIFEHHLHLSHTKIRCIEQLSVIQAFGVTFLGRVG